MVKKNLEAITIDYSSKDENGKLIWLISDKERMVFDKKRELYEFNGACIREFEKNNIFISKVDLENDLFEVIPEKLTNVFGDNPVDTLQDKKLLNMLKLIDNLNDEECYKIFNHDRFKALKRLVES